MAVAKLISPVSKQKIGKTRVAAYCRVSSNSADQEHSYATQVRVYSKMIHDRQDWELVDIFADEGLSGMKAENRTEFQRMIRMCEHREIDLIITKSVSRFARNVKESLSYARKLKRIGVGIQFEKEGINATPSAACRDVVFSDNAPDITEALRHSRGGAVFSGHPTALSIAAYVETADLKLTRIEPLSVLIG